MGYALLTLGCLHYEIIDLSKLLYSVYPRNVTKTMGVLHVAMQLWLYPRGLRCSKLSKSSDESRNVECSFFLTYFFTMSNISFLNEQIHLIWDRLLRLDTTNAKHWPESQMLVTCRTPVSTDLRGIKFEPENASHFVPSSAGIQGVTPV
jgi:hypothetical protein